MGLDFGQVPSLFAMRLVRSANSEIRTRSLPKTPVINVSFNGVVQFVGIASAPNIAPSIEPHVAPLQSVSNPDDTAIRTVAEKSPRPCSSEAATTSAFEIT